MKHRTMVRGIGVGVGEDGPNVPAVVFKVRNEFLPTVITSDQAQAIQFGLSGEQFEHPLTHNLLAGMVTGFGEVVDSTRIDDLPNDMFPAKVDVGHYHDGEARSVVFDTRPNDTITPAVRVGCPILISDKVLDAAG